MKNININISLTEKEIYRLNAMLLNNIAQLNPNIPDKDLQFYVDLHNKITGDVLSIENVREHFFKQQIKNNELDELTVGDIVKGIKENGLFECDETKAIQAIKKYNKIVIVQYNKDTGKYLLMKAKEIV